MFLVNSRFPLLSAAIPRSTREGASRVRPPFSLSYGGNLPSSLTTVRPSPRYSLPDHLCRFRVRAADNSLEAFLGSIGSLTSPDTARHHVSPSCAPRICLWHGLHACPGTTTGRVQLPSCVTPSLAYYPPGSRSPRSRSEDLDQIDRLAQMRFSMVASSRVREYQPVVHRLRLSASP